MMSEQLKHKMHQWEAPPPPACWEAIAARLHDAQAPLAARLYDLEIPPPAFSWNNITAALDNNGAEKAPVIPLSRRVYPLAAVAAIVLLLLAGARWMTGRTGKTDIAAGQPRTAPAGSKPAVSRITRPAARENDPDDTETAGNDNGYQAPMPKHVSSDARVLKYTSVNIQPAYRAYPIAVGQSAPPYDDPSVLNNMNPLLTNKDYLMITSPNGEITRASPKIAEALRYLYAETDPDETPGKTTNENSHWKKRLEEWRNKIISSHFIPTSANFLDIIDLKELIYEKP
jgi:hypothetical protein